MIPHQRLPELFNPLRRAVRHDENVPESLPFLGHPDLSNAFDDLIHIGVAGPLERVYRSLGQGTSPVLFEFYVFVDGPRLGVQSSESRFRTAQLWTVSFEVSSANVEGKEAGYRWVSKLRSWRREHGSQSEEVLVGFEGIFDEWRPAKEFDYGVIEKNREAIVYTPAAEHAERSQGSG